METAPEQSEAGEQRAPDKRLLVAVLLTSILGLAVASLVYWRHAAVHLRPVARVPRCVLVTRAQLRKPKLTSGSEEYITTDGTSVFLTPPEYWAAFCVERVSRPLGSRFAVAFTELEPEIMGLELLKILRDVPADPAHDQEAVAAFLLASGALQSLPVLPETKAADEEINLLHACRFATSAECPTRPPIPVIVWIAGVPSAIGALGVLGLLTREGVVRLVAWRRAKKAKRAQASASKPSDAG